MPQINGIVSGLDTANIIEQLKTLAMASVQKMEGRKAELQNKAGAWDAMSAKFADLRAASQSLLQSLEKRPAMVTTGDFSLLGVQVTGAAEVGSHTVRVMSLARGQESLSRSFAAVDTPIMGTGTITLRAGIGADDHDVNGSTRLADLNGGAGVSLGTIRVTDRSGATADIDLSGGVTVQDVLDDISAAAGVRVTARLTEDGTGILIQDDTASTNSGLKIEDVSSTAAQDLGILTGVNGVAAAQVKGTDLDPVFTITVNSANNTLAKLRDAVNALNGPFSASILNDGTPGAPYRLAILSKTTGAVGAVDITVQTDAVVDEAVGTGTGAAGSELGDYRLSASPLASAADLTSLTVGGVAFTARALGANTGVGNEVELEASTGRLRFFVDGVAADVTGEILASYTPAGPSFTTAQAATDAVLQIGTTNPHSFSSRTNLFTQAIPGLTMNLLSANPDKTVEVIVQPNVNAAADSVKKYVDAYNAVVEAVRVQNTYDVERQRKGGPLFGETILNNALNQVMQAVTANVESLPASANSIFQFGVKAGARGTLAVDSIALQDALVNRFDDLRSVFIRNANAARQATPSTSGTAAGFDAADVINGETSSAAFGADPGEGWMDDTPGVYPDLFTLRFPTARTLVKATLWTVDGPGQTAATTGIKDYELQALRLGGDAGVETDWRTVASVRNNTQGSRTNLFTAVTEQLRVKILGVNAADGASRLVELEAFEAGGSAARTGALVDTLTDSAVGLFAQARTETNKRVADMTTRIEAATARVNRETARMEAQFQQMEKVLSQLQGFSQSLNALLSASSTLTTASNNAQGK